MGFKAKLMVSLLLASHLFADMPYQVMQQKIANLEKMAENTTSNIEQLSKNDLVLEERLKNAEKRVAELEAFKASAKEMIETLRKISQDNLEYYKKLYDEQRALKKELAKLGSASSSTQDKELLKKLEEQSAKIAEMNKDIDALFSKVLELKGSMQKAGDNKAIEEKIGAIDEKVTTINKDVDVLFSKLLELKGSVDKLKKDQTQSNIQAFETKEKVESKPNEQKEAPNKEEPKKEEKPAATQ